MLTKYKINFYIRIISCILLNIIPSLFLFEILPSFVLPLWTLILIFLAYKIKEKKIILSSSILILFISCIIFWFAILLICKFISQNIFDILYLRIEIIIPFIIIQSLFITSSTILFLKKEKYRYYEPLIFLFIFILFFISQKNYSLSVFEHPIYATIFSISFFLLEITRLFLSSNFQKKQYKFFLIFLPILFLASFFILKYYNRSSTSNNGGLLEPTIFRFDFSDYLKLQNEIKMKDDLVLIAKFPSEFSHCMLRRAYLSAWDPRRGFYNKKAPDEFQQLKTLPYGQKKIRHKSFDLRETCEQEYFFINISPNSFIAMDYPTKVIPYKIWDNKKFNGGYKVISQAPLAFSEDLCGENAPTGDKNEGLSKKDLDFYTKIDEETFKLVHEKAIEITKDIPNYLDKILALQHFFTESEYRYSLKPGTAPDGNQLKYFLEKSKKGYCTYYAFAYTLMLRSIGIPSRVAVGFITQANSEVMNYYPVRANMAHAWTEVFFPNIGWISFDATSQKLAEGENLNFSMNAGGKEFNELVTEILENRDKIEYSELIEYEDENVKDIIVKNIKYFLHNNINIFKIILIICIILIIVFYKIRNILLLKFSKNNRKIILIAEKIFNKKEKNESELKEEMYILKQKAKFSKICTKEDAQRAKEILKLQKKQKGEEK